MDTDRHADPSRRAGRRAHEGGTDMWLRAFHLFFIALSVVLAAFFAAWAVGSIALGTMPIYVVASAGSSRIGGWPCRVRRGFQRKTRNL